MLFYNSGRVMSKEIMSNFSELRHDLCSLAPVPSSEWTRARDIFSPVTFDKNELFIQQGTKSERFGIIAAGVFRVYCTTADGDEKTLAFRTKGQFLAVFSPHLEGKDCWYSVQAIGKSFVYESTLGAIRSFAKGHDCWDKVFRNYLVRLYVEKEDRERSFLTEDATTRFIKFREAFPALEKLVPDFHIASYLGMSPITLSRIHRSLNEAEPSNIDL